MRSDTWGMRMVRILIPLGIHLISGLLVLSIWPGQGLLGTLFTNTFSFACLLPFFMKDNKIIVWEKPVLRIEHWGMIVVGGAAACLAVNTFFSVTGLIKLLSKSYRDITTALYSDQLWLECLVMIVAAPLLEEILFRGLVFRKMRTYLSYLPAAIASSLIFGLFHGNLIQGIYGFVLGMLLTWFYERTRTIIVPVIVHAVANLISVLCTEWGPASLFIGRYTWVVWISSTAILAGSMILLKKRIQK